MAAFRRRGVALPPPLVVADSWYSDSKLMYPVQFVAARRPRACGVGTTDDKVHGDHEFAIANDHYQEDPINAREDPVFLPTPPGTDKSQLLPILFEHRVIGDPGPLPPAPRGLALADGIAPQWYQHLQAQASESLKPGAFGQRTEQAGGQ